MIGHQGGVGQTGASPSDPHGPLQQGRDAGREAIITGVDGVLGVAQQMGQTDLMVCGRPSHLRGEAVGDPDRGPDVAEEVPGPPPCCGWDG